MSSPNVPSPPDPSVAAIAGMQADASNFPLTWMINALAQTGGKATIGGQTYDFTGQGNADQSAKMSDQMAQALLDIQRSTGSAQIQQRLADLKLADPTGYAARQQLFDKIAQDAQANPNRPMAQDLQDQISAMLGDAGHLDSTALQQIQQGVRGQQVAKGIFLGNAPASEEASAVVRASDQLRAQQQKTAQDYLTSGVSPQDVQYRRIQQSLANLGAFVNNQTPEAQFGQLSGAQNGAAPFNPVNYSTPAEMNPNSAATGLNFANSLFGINANNAQAQSNPWLAGLSTAASGINAAANTGLFRTAPMAPLTTSQISNFNAGFGPVAPSYQPPAPPSYAGQQFFPLSGP